MVVSLQRQLLAPNRIAAFKVAVQHTNISHTGFSCSAVCLPGMAGNGTGRPTRDIAPAKAL
jgi:hypothetical protein